MARLHPGDLVDVACDFDHGTSGKRGPNEPEICTVCWESGFYFRNDKLIGGGAGLDMDGWARMVEASMKTFGVPRVWTESTQPYSSDSSKKEAMHMAWTVTGFGVVTLTTSRIVTPHPTDAHPDQVIVESSEYGIDLVPHLATN
jgi:hypothetical protein